MGRERDGYPLWASWRRAHRTALVKGALGLVRRRRIGLTGTAWSMDRTCWAIHQVQPMWRFLNKGARRTPGS